jgi:alpha-galactosidase
MLCWAVAEASPIRTVGLCHSVQHTAGELARDLRVPAAEVDHHVAGINHMAFFLRLERHGVDLYPALRRVIEEGRVPEGNRVRYELFRQFGAFVTESSEHLAEYVPWFIKAARPDLIDRFNIPLDEYIHRSERQIAEWNTFSARLSAGGVVEPRRSDEYGADIINACETGEPFAFNGNVPNTYGGRTLIDNLPADCCVEVPCLVDGAGVQPTHVGALPPQLAALNRTFVNVADLTVQAALRGRREHVYHAAMLDPNTAATLTQDQIWRLCDELIEAHGDALPQELRRGVPAGA